MSDPNLATEDQFDFYGRGYVAGLKQGSDMGYAQCAAEIADLKAQLNAAYAEDRDTHAPTWSETYAETLRHAEDRSAS